MGGRNGRRATPTALKILQGVRSSRINWHEPRPPADRPPKPAHLAGIAAAEWDRLAQIAEDMGVLTVADGPMLEATAGAYAEWRQALAAIKSGGAYYEAKTTAGATMIRTHPAVAAAGDAWRRYVQGLGAFGLSPATRSKVARAPQPPAERLEKYTRPKDDPRRVLAALKRGGK